MASAPHIWLAKPPCGTGVQMSKVYPVPQLRWLVWYGGKIVRFCESPDQAFAWYFLVQAEGPDIAERLQTYVLVVKGGWEPMRYLARDLIVMSVNEEGESK